MTVRRAETQTTSLGRYRVVKRLANGGMADVLLARTEGIQGFERHVVIKRIHPELLEEQRYIKMFLDEARLAASLHHHNIVQVNDIGEQGGNYFFAMEYVHGEDARGLLVNASKRGQQIPIEHVITIISAAAAGLHHAHEQCAADRTPLGIVHRDVSPANILVGFDGSVKVADFGIALAAHRAEHTQSGVLKGKVAYMSPEQCNCERVDRRSDVFSLGICLYELATVHPCFAAANDFMTMSAIVARRFTPPQHLSAHVTPALAAIIDKALARDPADRYQTADELRLALEKYAADANIRNSATALADYMKEQFGSRALPWQEEAPATVSDEELEIVLSPLGEVFRPIPLAEPGDRLEESVVVDEHLAHEEDLAIPHEPTPTDASDRNRPIKQTLPLRAVKKRVLPLRAPDLSPPPTPLALVPPSEPEPGAAPSADPTDDPSDDPSAEPTDDPSDDEVIELVPAAAVSLPVPPRRRARMWPLAATLGLVLAVAGTVWFAWPSERADAKAMRTRPHARPLPAPSFSVPPPSATEQPVVEPAAERKPVRATRPRPASAPPPSDAKWNPDALFPK